MDSRISLHGEPGRDRDRDRGEGPGAPVAIYDSSSDIMSKTKADASYKDRLPNGNYIEKTASHFVIITGDSPSTLIIYLQMKLNDRKYCFS